MAVEFEFFWGFDELWLFDVEPLNDVPEHLELPAEEVCLPEQFATLVALDEWMASSGAVLGLADGLGLSYVTTDGSIADLLDGA